MDIKLSIIIPIYNEEQNIPLFELMNNENLPDLVFSTKINQVGGPLKTSDGEIIFKVIDEKQFDQAEYEKSKDYIMPAAAIAFRQGHVRRSTKIYQYRPSAMPAGTSGPSTSRRFHAPHATAATSRC